MAEKLKRTGSMSRTRKIVIAVLIGAIIILGVTTAATVHFIRPILAVGIAFREAVAADDLDAAYAMLAPNVQADVGQDAFNDYFTTFTLSDWSYSQPILRNGVGHWTGNISLNGEAYQFEMEFTKVDDEWRISKYNIYQSAGRF